MSKIHAVTREDFDREVIGSTIPVVVDFWAEWCAPCHRVRPILEALAGEYAGRVRVAKVDVDDQAELAGRFAIRSMPTFLVIRNGEVVEQFAGVRPCAEFEARFASLAEA